LINPLSKIPQHRVLRRIETEPTFNPGKPKELFKGTYFSIHPIRTDSEIRDNYGDFIFTQEGSVAGKAEIVDASESIYLPAKYLLKNVEILGDANIELLEIVSYEGLFCDMFKFAFGFQSGIGYFDDVTAHFG